MWWCSKKNTDCKLEIYCCESFNLKGDIVEKIMEVFVNQLVMLCYCSVLFQY